jgi:ribosomal protein S9
VVNRKAFDAYFPNETLRMIIRQPLNLTETANKFDVLANVAGGGLRDKPAQFVTASRARCLNTTPTCGRR